MASFSSNLRSFVSPQSSDFLRGGRVDIGTAASDTTGAVVLGSGAASSGSSGNLVLSTGAAAGTAGSLTLSSETPLTPIWSRVCLICNHIRPSRVQIDLIRRHFGAWDGWAPRVHNSGHLTINAYNISQFENHIRAVCKLDQLPIKKISDARMLNIIGNQIINYRDKKYAENEFFFDYLKKEIKEKRKMGHLTTLIS